LKSSKSSTVRKPSVLEVFYDLRERRYLANGIDNDRNVYRFSEGGDPREFTPNALLYYVK
jgi:hypothetical protein